MEVYAKTLEDQEKEAIAKEQEKLGKDLLKDWKSDYGKSWDGNFALKFASAMEMARIHTAVLLENYFSKDIYKKFLGWNAPRTKKFVSLAQKIEEQFQTENQFPKDEMLKRTNHLIKQISYKLLYYTLKVFYNYDIEGYFNDDYTKFDCKKAPESLKIDIVKDKYRYMVDPLLRPHTPDNGFFTKNDLHIPSRAICLLAESCVQSVFEDVSVHRGTVGGAINSLWIPNLPRNPNNAGQADGLAGIFEEQKPIACTSKQLNSDDWTQTEHCSVKIPPSAANLFQRQFSALGELSAFFNEKEKELRPPEVMATMQIFMQNYFKSNDWSVYPENVGGKVSTTKTFRDWSFEAWRAVPLRDYEKEKVNHL